MGSAQRTHRLTRGRAAVGALLLAACAVAAIVLLGSANGKGRAPTIGVPVGDTTTTVTRRTLTESSTVDGTLGYGATLELYDRLPGTFTWLPSVGMTIARGGTLFRVDDLPVVLMYGSVPAYRALREGVGDGPDVAELNRNLITLGYDPYGAITDDSRYSEATAAAVRRWQHAEGLPETGEVQLGRVVFAPSARRVTAVHVALGQDPPGGAGSGASASPSSGASASGPSLSASASSPSSGKAGDEPAGGKSPSKAGESKEMPASAEKPKGGKPKDDKTEGDKTKEGSEPGSESGSESGNKGDKPKPGKKSGKPKAGEQPSGKGGSTESPSEASPKGSSGKAPGSEGSKPEGGAGAGTAVLATTSTQQLVQLKLKAEQQQLAHIGERAPVTLPGGEVVQGRIVEVGTVASEAKGGENEKGGGGGGGGSPGGEGGGESATIPVTLALARHVARLDQAPVSVELVKSIRRNVLALPATALLATGGGSYAIEVLEGDRRVELPVTPGMFAGGYVQVEGSGLSEGQTVIESE